ncbi:MAG: HAD hydrolase-like protein, partial [Chloroflexota bacterium]
TLCELRQRGLKLLFFTNANAHSVSFWHDRLEKIGIEATPNEILTSALVAAEAVKELYPDRKILPVGGEGLIEALQQQELHLLDINQAAEADVVVMGKAHHFNHQWLEAVCEAIWSGAKFIVTNIDPRVPTAIGFKPGTGPMIKAVAYATGCDPLVTGKPSEWAVKSALTHLKATPEQVGLVGDQLEVDIALGKRAGFFTFLVLKGVTPPDQIEAIPMTLQPDLILPEVGDLLEWIDREYQA